jgi:hypothetical protein
MEHRAPAWQFHLHDTQQELKPICVPKNFKIIDTMWGID